MPAAMDDLDAKVRAFLLDAQSEDSAAHHTFAQRAESYYQKRPHLLSLLRRLHSAYLSLLLSSHRPHNNKQLLSDAVLHHADEDDTLTSPSSDGAESTLSTISSSSASSSFTSGQYPARNKSVPGSMLDHHDDHLVMDALVVEMVMKGVECDFVDHELGSSQTRAESLARRSELQGSLVAVLESERLVLAGENSRLRWKAAALTEEGDALASEAAFLRRRVTDLAATLTRTRMEEGRMAVVLNRRIEDLRRQIYRLERWNRVVVVKEEGKERGENLCSKCRERSGGGRRLGERVSRWRDKMKGFDFFLCGPHRSTSEASSNV